MVKYYGAYTDGDGTIYYYDITSRDIYGITKIDKYTAEMEESFDETIV